MARTIIIREFLFDVTIIDPRTERVTESPVDNILYSVDQCDSAYNVHYDCCRLRNHFHLLVFVEG